MKGAIRYGGISLITLLGCEPFFPGEVDPAQSLEQPLDGLSPTQNAAFGEGDEAFSESFSAESGLGPIFNMPSCQSCHNADGKGHPATNLIRFGKDSGGGDFDYLVEKGGPQLQNRAIPGYEPERIPSEATGISVRSAPIVSGVGFLEIIPDSTLLSLADPEDSDADGISGRVNYVPPPDYFQPESWHVPENGMYIGRFGRKATALNLLHQTVVAYLNDMGITSDFSHVDIYNPLAGEFTGDRVADPEVGSSTVRNVVFYLRTLRPPVRRDEDDPDVLSGEQLFTEIGCEKCHTAVLKTTVSEIAVLSEKEIHPYTDLLLHDMGPELADDYPEGDATGREWRTTPLWGLGVIKNNLGGVPYFLHDGRTSDLQEAIELHGGEASETRISFQSLTDTEKGQLIRFLESL